ncbi:MAG: TraR/DksA C4-type zinc finger protein [Deltaproteobacteria bacterium]|nr:TraR/DksA C4-type zinc finger protein [Deltaproteobacteria bacterium]
MDVADCAQRNEGWLLKAGIDSHRINNTDINETIECIDCGEDIPAARRKAAPGCERCIYCQEVYEGA